MLGHLPSTVRGAEIARGKPYGFPSVVGLKTADGRNFRLSRMRDNLCNLWTIPIQPRFQ